MQIWALGVLGVVLGCWAGLAAGLGCSARYGWVTGPLTGHLGVTGRQAACGLRLIARGVFSLAAAPGHRSVLILGPSVHTVCPALPY